MPRRGADPALEAQVPEAVAELPLLRRSTGLRELIDEAAREVPADIPGIELVRGWEVSLRAAVEALAALRAVPSRPILRTCSWRSCGVSSWWT